MLQVMCGGCREKRVDLVLREAGWEAGSAWKKRLGTAQSISTTRMRLLPGTSETAKPLEKSTLSDCGARGFLSCGMRELRVPTRSDG